LCCIAKSGESLKKVFDKLFEMVLYAREKSTYKKEGVFKRFLAGEIRPCDFFGGIHLLRFIILLSKMASIESEQRMRGSSSRHRRSASDAGGAAPQMIDDAAVSIEFLTSNTLVSVLRDVSSELDNIYPLAIHP
jgi:hypothetical protein